MLVCSHVSVCADVPPQVTEAIVSLAVAEHLVTPHTSAVGVLLLKDPMDPSAVRRTEVPLQVGLTANPIIPKRLVSRQSLGDQIMGGGLTGMLAGGHQACRHC